MALLDAVLQLIKSSNPTTCLLDPIPSALFQSISKDLLPFITFLINKSLSSGEVPSTPTTTDRTSSRTPTSSVLGPLLFSLGFQSHLCMSVWHLLMDGSSPPEAQS
ncbi:hypothetical protein AOLI_G00084400 [Acnodon oligacanthus]